MKKLAILFSMFILMFTLAACDQISGVIDEVDPELSGIEDITIAVGSSFNVMDGVTANDDQDGDITDLITYTITDEVGNPVTIDLTQEGIYYIRYTVSDEAGNTVTADRRLTISLTGQSNDIVHVLLSSADAAKARLEEFYFDVLESGLTPQELCDKYIGDVPFPINDSDVSQCVEGIASVRQEYASVDVLTVTEQNHEGHPVYGATVHVVLSDQQSHEGEVIFAFLTQGELGESYLHFYGDPFVHDNNNVDLGQVQGELEMFYDSFFDVFYDTSLFCNTYLNGLMPPEDCVDFVEYARDMVDSIEVVSVVEAPITYPDGTSGDGYLGYIEMYVDGNLIGFDLYFFFVEDPNTGDIVLLVPLNDPLGYELFPQVDAIIVPPSQARPIIEAFYSELLDINYPVEIVCSDYIARSVIPGPTQAECEEAITQMRDSVTYLEIVTLYQQDVPMGPGMMIPGYVVEIYFETGEGDHTVMVPLFFADYEGSVVPILLSGPLGDDGGHGMELINIPEPDAQALLDEFYLMVQDPNVDFLMFCQMYFETLMLPVDPLEIEECSNSLNHLRNGLQGHMVIDVSPTYIESDFVYGDGYYSNVELYTPDGTKTITVEYGFVQTPNGLQIIILSNPGGDDGHQPFDTITVPIPDALLYIEQFYGWLLAVDTPVEQVCNEYMSYVPFEGPNYDECIDVINHMRMYVQNLAVINVYEGPIDMGGMAIDGYYATVQFDDLYNSETVSVDIPFVFIDDMGVTRVIMLDHPLGYHDGGGEYLYLIPVPTLDVENAVNGFYDAIADPNVDLYAFCESYMNPLPFPYEPYDIQNCADDLNNMRMGLLSHQIMGVNMMDIHWEGLEGTAYEIYIQFFDMNIQVHDAYIIVGFIDTPNGPVFIMLTNPGGGEQQIPLIELDIPTAQNELMNLLELLFVTDQDVALTCQTYLEYLPMEMDQMMCENEWSELSSVYSSYHIVSVNQEPSNDHMFSGTIYVAQIEYTDINGGIAPRMIRFGFVESPNGPKLLIMGSLFGEEPPRQYNIVPYALPDAHDMLHNMYTSLLSSSVDVTLFCQEYIDDDPYGPPLQECVDVISAIRMDYITFTIDGLVEEGVPLDDVFVNGFHAMLTLDGPAGPNSIDVFFIITDNNHDGILEFIFLSHPSGENENMLQFITVPVDEVEMVLNIFYGELLDPNMDAMMVCESYILYNPFTMFDSNSCSAYVLELQQMGLFYSINHINTTNHQLPTGEYVPGYMANITITFDGNVQSTFDIAFGFIPDYDLGYKFIFFTENFVQGEPGQSQYATMSEIDAQNWIIQFYDALVGNSVDPVLFCQVYLMLDDTMQPMDPATCESIKTEFEGAGFSFSVGPATFNPETVGSPPYFTATVSRTYMGETITYEASFIFLLDPNGQILLATPMYHAVGHNYEPPLQFVSETYAQANAYLLEMYDMVFDTTLDPQFVCDHYSTMTPVDMYGFCEDIMYFRHLDVGNDYVIQQVLEFYIDGVQHYKVVVNEVHDDGSVHTFETHFVFVLNQDSMKVAVPLHPLVVDPDMTYNPDINVANTMLLEYYADLFDPSISDIDFCNEHHLTNPFYMGTEADCIDGRQFSLSRSESYNPGPATIWGYDPYLVFESDVFISDSFGSITVPMQFAILQVSGIDYLVLMSELIHDIPLP